MSNKLSCCPKIVDVIVPNKSRQIEMRIIELIVFIHINIAIALCRFGNSRAKIDNIVEKQWNR